MKFGDVNLRTITTSEKEEYRQVYQFIANHSYPTGFAKNQKRVLRRKCQECFCIRRESFEKKVSRVFLYQEWATLLCRRE